MTPTPWLHHPDIWRFGERLEGPRAGIATGFAALDAALPGGCWPHHLVELLCDDVGIGELSVMAPALAEQTRAGQMCAWVNPPYLPNAPALNAQGIALKQLLMVRATHDQDALWSAERLAMSGACAAVVLWARHALAYPSLQRLCMAAVRGPCVLFLYRPSVARHSPSPAALRIGLRAGFVKDEACDIRLTLIKRRGALRHEKIRLCTAAHVWPTQAQQSLAARDERIRRIETAARRARLNVLATPVQVPLVERHYPLPDR